MKYKIFEQEHNYKHSNIVFLSSCIAYFILIPFFYIVGGIRISLIYLGCMFFSFVALSLNKKSKYSISMLVFIITMNLSTIFSVYMIGSQSGFFYYFFNLSVLIIFSTWSGRGKLIALTLQTIIFIMLYYRTYNLVPYYNINVNILIFIHILNVMFNIVGVSNSAHYYIKVVKKYQAEITQIASTDYLTNLSNRVVFDEEMIKTERDNSSSCIVLIDIDNFKLINDNYGHICGDYVLKEVSKILLSLTNKNDILSRFGGEEFAIIMKSDSLEMARIKVNEIRKKIESLLLEYRENKISITVSIGAVYRKTNEQYCSFEILNIVDELLYKAKNTGKNKVVFKET